MLKNNYFNLSVLILIVAFFSFTFCASEASKSSEAKEVSEVTEVKVEKKKVLRHVVALQFKDDISDEQTAEAVQFFMDLKDKIPQILKFEGGTDISVENLTKDFTHCFILTFEDEAARDAYLPHPAHMEVVKKNKPMLKDLLVMDFWGEE